MITLRSLFEFFNIYFQRLTSHYVFNQFWLIILSIWLIRNVLNGGLQRCDNTIRGLLSLSLDDNFDQLWFLNFCWTINITLNINTILLIITEQWVYENLIKSYRILFWIESNYICFWSPYSLFISNIILLDPSCIIYIFRLKYLIIDWSTCGCSHCPRFRNLVCCLILILALDVSNSIWEWLWFFYLLSVTNWP